MGVYRTQTPAAADWFSSRAGMVDYCPVRSDRPIARCSWDERKMADVVVELNNPLQAPAAARSAEPPLCVDLDGTLIATDSLSESLLLLARNHPVDLLRLPNWILAGKARLKDEIVKRVTVDVALLPYREQVLELLRA